MLSLVICGALWLCKPLPAGHVDLLPSTAPHLFSFLLAAAAFLSAAVSGLSV